MKLGKKSISLFKAIMDLGRDAHTFMDVDRCTAVILDKASDILGTELGSIMLVDEKNKHLFIKKAKGFNGEIAKKTKVRLGEGISGWVAKTGLPLLIRDLSKDKRFNRFRKNDTKRYKTDSLLSAPLKIGERIIGVINVNNKKTGRQFTKDDLELLSFIAEQAALAIHNALIYEDTRRIADTKLDFLSDISHELKNPLATIRESVLLALADSRTKTDAKMTRILEIAINNIDRINRLLSSLLDLARLEAGKSYIHRSYMDIKKLINESVDFIKPPAEAKGIKIKIDFSMKYSKMWADYDKITQVMHNLLNNAVKFTPEGGRVTIGVREKDSRVFIWVQDSGAGIKKENLPRLFNKFERLDIDKGKTAGTGLGLAICKEIIDIHKGRIWAESALNKGSKFNLILPKDLRKEERP